MQQVVLVYYLYYTIAIIAIVWLLILLTNEAIATPSIMQVMSSTNCSITYNNHYVIPVIGKTLTLQLSSNADVVTNGWILYHLTNTTWVIRNQFYIDSLLTRSSNNLATLTENSNDPNSLLVIDTDGTDITINSIDRRYKLVVQDNLLLFSTTQPATKFHLLHK